MAVSEMPTAEERARKRAEEWASVWWHVAAYVVINPFLWMLDWLPDERFQWVFWVTVPWGVALALHIAAYQIEIRGVKDRKYEQFLAQEREREDVS